MRCSMRRVCRFRRVQSRRLGKTGREVSEIGFGAWAIGGSWGETDDDESLAALHAAVDAGVTFFDTADVYGDGRSERLIARLLRERTRAARRRDEVRPARAARRRALHATTTSAPGSSARARTSASTRSTSSSSTARRGTRYYTPTVFEACDRLVEEGLVARLRRQRREGRGGAEGDRVPGRRDGADHLQHLPAAAGRALLRSRRGARRRRDRRACRSRPAC